MNRLFDDISTRLAQYLRIETEGKEIDKIDSIAQEITNDTQVISFNYTNTIKLYTDKCYYVHGSIDEDKGNIVLGFPQNNIPDFCTGEYMKRHKDYQKELLNFSRFLRQNCYEASHELSGQLEECLDSLYSGRGEYVFPKEPAHCRTDCIVIEYARKNGFSRFDDGLDFAPLQEVVIIGHGLEADLMYIENIFAKIKNLRRVKLFTFAGEEQLELMQKEIICRE